MYSKQVTYIDYVIFVSFYIFVCLLLGGGFLCGFLMFLFSIVCVCVLFVLFVDYLGTTKYILLNNLCNHLMHVISLVKSYKQKTIFVRTKPYTHRSKTRFESLDIRKARTHWIHRHVYPE